jgi:HEAT repeat protein
MAAAFAEADLEVGLALIRVLARIGSPEARNALMRASTSPHAVVRIEALGHVEGVASERVRLELKALLEDPEPNVRAAALRAMQHHHIRAAGPGLVLRIRSAEFDKLTVDEKRLTLETLVTLAPNRAEAVCLELLEKARVVSSEAHEHTRAIAAELLGRVGSSPEVLDALDEASSARWRNSERVRQTAARAKNYMELRLSQPPPAAPAISVPPIHTVPPRTNPPTGRKP